MFDELELVVRRAGHSFRYFDGSGRPVGAAVFERDRDRHHVYSSSCTIRRADQELLLIAWRLRSSESPVLSHFELCDEGGNTIAGVDVLKSRSVHCIVTAAGEPFGELKSRSTARSFSIDDAEGREIGSIKSASLYAGRRYRMTRCGPLEPLWQRITTFLSLMPVLYPPPPLGFRTPSATFPL
jgi:hypothetical protein